MTRFGSENFKDFLTFWYSIINYEMNNEDIGILIKITESINIEYLSLLI